MNHTSYSGATLALLVLVTPPVAAHEWHRHPNEGYQKSVYVLTGNPQKADMKDKPDIARHFEHCKNVKTRWDSDMLYVESNGLPDHNMMVGIRAWQQQVPLPQPYMGDNAWQIPLNPKLADKPVSAKNSLYRGAIALAVNGVPIFNALNNRGEDAFLAGELDKWGGHCGRGDDYHYHIAPVHLEDIVGKGQPIAYALDGFPIYGLTEAGGSPVGQLDEFNGQLDEQGRYHYHATKKYPYINGGMRGVVTIRGDQIEPQPRDSPIRPALQPLRGATITDFETTGQQSTLTYSLEGQTGTVTYSPDAAETWKFKYTEPNGRSSVETYERRPRGDGRRPPPPPRGNRPPPPR
ncbi:YHYH protein [Bythopirellula polymerisocia]|uniref:YHYH domain-containing protein n=1 Tax=Bythopirellula polymerisocia TaxID=2528003 RepID=A0A5C6CD79_9BACT|nr:YHYH protein [Bythopirellula polymerisocia]TWU20769.1 hypothetical protein Pla144_48200 [Bythopirellula polymerisocia]